LGILEPITNHIESVTMSKIILTLHLQDNIFHSFLISLHNETLGILEPVTKKTHGIDCYTRTFKIFSLINSCLLVKIMLWSIVDIISTGINVRKQTIIRNHLLYLNNDIVSTINVLCWIHHVSIPPSNYFIINLYIFSSNSLNLSMKQFHTSCSSASLGVYK
jgi:hypothetical protein